MEVLSIIVPAYNEAEMVPIFYEETVKHIEKLDVDVQFVFVDDGSKDATFTELVALAEKDSRVNYISFSRNFGKEAAILAGLEHARGDYAVVMDADLQDPPALLSTMLDAIRIEGYDCVGTRRVTRKGEPVIRSFFARTFYKLMDKISKTKIVDGARDFQMMTRPVLDAVLSMKEYNRFTKGIYEWVGFKKKWLEYENIERVAGQTKWNFFSLMVYAIEGITAFSTAPLILSSVIGLLMCIAGFVAIVFIIVRTLVFGDPTDGWPSLVCIILMVSGVQMFCIGIVGHYLAKTYLETKNRPSYIIGKTNLK